MQLTHAEDIWDIDVVVIARAMGEYAESVKEIQPCFGGKAYAINWNEETDAISAASRGFNFNGHYFDLRLLGCKSIDVQFSLREFPMQYLIELDAMLQRI